MNTTTLGKLYLIPITLGENDPTEVLPITIKTTIAAIDDYIVENEKTARKLLRVSIPKKYKPHFD